jgi:tripartite-type tricarboxylate transporter receptor subunit TctC
MGPSRLRFPLAVLGLLAGMAAASADDPYYKGKRLTLLVNYAAGGPADLEARLFARYIGRHIEGQPSVIVQNMDGAGGFVGTSYVGAVAPKDGTVIGYLSGAAFRYINDPERHRIDLKSYEFIASQSGASVYYVRSDVAPGMKRASDIIRAQGLIAGGLGPENAKDLRIRLTLDLLGVPFKYVTGYRSSAPARLALQRGEINFYSELSPGYRAVVQPGLVEAGEAIPVYCDPVYEQGVLGRSKNMDGLPIATFSEFYRDIRGAAPAGELWAAYRTILTVTGTMQLVLAAPPGTPDTAVDALRSGVAALASDKDYAEEAHRSIGFAPDWRTGSDTNTRVREGLTVSPEMHAFLAGYIKKGNR